jgi:hypothetical protein
MQSGQSSAVCLDFYTGRDAETAIDADPEMQKTICLMSFSPISRDARVLRQLSYLSKHFSVSVVGFGELDGPLGANVRMLSVPRPAGVGIMRKARTLTLLPLGRILPMWAYETWYWGRTEHLSALPLIVRCAPDAIHANDWDTLPLAVKASRLTGARIVLDLHEYAPLQWANRRYWKALTSPMVDYFIRKYAPKASATVTVSKLIADRYTREYGFRPQVVMNAPQRDTVPCFRPTNPEHIRLVHHGGALRDRQLDLMIRAMAHIDARYSLHFMLIETSPGYYSELKALAQRLVPGRVSFHEPVPPAQIVDKLSAFDLGVYLLPPVNFNHAAALPNKFFDFVAAGLGVCIGPSPEMARLSQQFGFGAVAPSFEPIDLAMLLNSLTTEDIDDMKRKAIEATDILNADVELNKLAALYDQLLPTHQ